MAILIAPHASAPATATCSPDRPGCALRALTGGGRLALQLHLSDFRVVRQNAKAAGHGVPIHHEAPDALDSRRREFGSPASFLFAVDELEVAHRHPLAVNDLVGLEDGRLWLVGSHDVVDDRFI